MDQIKIGKYIQKLRKEKELTQKQLADKFGITFQAVSKWESGETLPDCSILLELCEILGTNVDLLLHGGTYIVNNRKLMSIKDVEKGFKAIEDVRKYFGEKSLFYIGMVEGINNKMNLDLEESMNNQRYKKILVAEVLLQGINSGKYYVDLEEVKQYFENKKVLEHIIVAMNKIK